MCVSFIYIRSSLHTLLSEKLSGYWVQESRVEGKHFFIDFLWKNPLVLTSLSKRSSLLELLAFAFWFRKTRKTEPDSPHKFLQCKFWLSVCSKRVVTHRWRCRKRRVVFSHWTQYFYRENLTIWKTYWYLDCNLLQTDLRNCRNDV